jgi:hypothetical protein
MSTRQEYPNGPPKFDGRVFNGAELVFKSPEELEEAISNYFASCWREKWEQNKNGEWVQCTDHEGNPLLEQNQPYTMAGMAVALGVTRQTVCNYAHRNEFTPIIHRARTICEAALEVGMLKGTIPAIPGIFSAKNNYGWTDKTEMDLNTQITEMGKITKGGKPLEFDVGTASDTEST